MQARGFSCYVQETLKATQDHHATHATKSLEETTSAHPSHVLPTTATRYATEVKSAAK